MYEFYNDPITLLFTHVKNSHVYVHQVQNSYKVKLVHVPSIKMSNNCS